jgi:hypothetical protein
VQDEEEGHSHRKRKARGTASPKKAKKKAISSKDTPASGGFSHSVCTVLFPSCVVVPPRGDDKEHKLRVTNCRCLFQKLLRHWEHQRFQFRLGLPPSCGCFEQRASPFTMTPLPSRLLPAVRSLVHLPPWPALDLEEHVDTRDLSR